METFSNRICVHQCLLTGAGDLAESSSVMARKGNITEFVLIITQDLIVFHSDLAYTA